MKTKKIELDVDFIGGLGSLTIKEEKALSEFFKQRKLQKSKAVYQTKTSRRASSFVKN